MKAKGKKAVKKAKPAEPQAALPAAEAVEKPVGAGKAAGNGKTKAALALAAILLLALVAYMALPRPMPRARLGDTDAFLVGHSAFDRASALVSGAEKVILIAEGDGSITQTTGYLSASAVYLSKDFPARLSHNDIYGIEYADGRPVKCINAELDFCQSYLPAENELLIRIRYPSFKENEIVVEGNTIEFRGKSGADTLALVKAFEDIFLR